MTVWDPSGAQWGPATGPQWIPHKCLLLKSSKHALGRCKTTLVPGQGGCQGWQRARPSPPLPELDQHSRPQACADTSRARAGQTSVELRGGTQPWAPGMSPTWLLTPTVPAAWPCDLGHRWMQSGHLIWVPGCSPEPLGGGEEGISLSCSLWPPHLKVGPWAQRRRRDQWPVGGRAFPTMRLCSSCGESFKRPLDEVGWGRGTGTHREPGCPVRCVCV